jgi:ribosomal protein L33
MTEPDEIKLHCSKCDPSRWIVKQRNNVIIRLNLEKDQYEFESTCHICGGDIFNSRGIYR